MYPCLLSSPLSLLPGLPPLFRVSDLSWASLLCVFTSLDLDSVYIRRKIQEREAREENQEKIGDPCFSETGHHPSVWEFKFPEYTHKMMYDMAPTILISIIAVVLIIITIGGNLMVSIIVDENHDIAIAMSPSRADPVLPWLGLFKYLNQCHWPGWEYLYI